MNKNMRTTARTAKGCFLALGLLACVSANATVITSTNPADFVLTAEDFAVIGFTNANLTSLSGTLTLDNANGVGTVGDLTGTHAYTNFNGVMPGNEYVLNGDENFDLLFSSAQTAFAMNYLDDSIASTFNLEFFSGATSVGAASFTTATFDTVEFIGFSSTAAFDRVTVREDDGTSNSDEFFQFFTATAVPEPATFALFGLGLFGLGGFGSRRKLEV